MSLTLAPIFGNHMVLQQGMPVPIWGTATPGSAVTVKFRGQSATASADATGKWIARLAPLAASAEPAELSVTATKAGAADAHLAFNDVLVGEVWVASGQSNMQWSVAVSDNPGKEITAANFPLIRLLTVPNRPAGKPMTDLPGSSWQACTPTNITSFSAVAYFFTRELHQKLGVPVGMIHSSWGGTPAEAWVSHEALNADPSLRPLAVDYERGLPSLDHLQAEYRQKLRDHEARTADTHNTGFPRGWAGTAEPEGQWKDMDLPAYWQYRGLNFSGILWFRRSVEIPAAWAGKDLELCVGAVDKSDTTYFNNEKVGSLTMKDRPDAFSVLRTYTVPGRLVKAGRNVIAVRVHSDIYAGGMSGPAELMKITCPAVAGATPIPLGGPWRYAVEANYGPVAAIPLPAGPDNPNSASTLFNGMISPLLPYALRGAIWYQGESNVGRAEEYNTLFAALIRDWRRQWGLDNLAFHFVQLANFMEAQALPMVGVTWAELREAQTAALKLPNTGMAVAIDIGEAADIHPRNKQDVGRRLALNALHHTYGKKDVVPCGPLFRQARHEGHAIRVSFDHVGGGLVFRGVQGQEPTGFTISGADGTYHWAQTRIDGDSVVVWSDAVRQPHAVRYGWADNPICKLYNAEGLPASPFRADAKG